MLDRPFIIFTALSFAAHAALLGVGTESMHADSGVQENSIEIGLVTLPRIEKEFSTHQKQLEITGTPQPAKERSEPERKREHLLPVANKTADSADINNSHKDPTFSKEALAAQKEPAPADPVPSRSTPGSTSPLVATEAAPLASRNKAPQYPAEALRYGWEGEVWLKVDVGRSGAVYRVRVDKSSGYPLLDRAALQTVKRWLFEPARIGHEAIDATVRVPVRFRIQRS